MGEWNNEGNGIWKSEGVARRFKTAQYVCVCVCVIYLIPLFVIVMVTEICFHANHLY